MKTINLFLNIILAAGAMQGVILVVFLFSGKKGNKKANRLLGLLLFCFLSSIGHYLFYSRFNTYFPLANKIAEPFQFMFGPLLFFYVKKLTNPEYKLYKRYIFHIIPFACSLLTVYMLNGFSEKISPALFSNICIALWIAMFFHLWIYLAAIYRYIYQYRKMVKKAFSSIHKINLSWITFFISGLALFYAFYLIFLPVLFHLPDQSIYFNKIAIAALALLIIFIGYKGLFQPVIFYGKALEEVIELNDKSATAAQKSKYIKSTLTPEYISSSFKKIREIIQTQTLFKNSELDLTDLADASGFSVHNISQIINLGSGKNFYDFINSYRVNEVIKLLSDPMHIEKYTILSMALDAGFKSKSTFNKYFKETTGQTPSQYISLHNHS